MNLIVLIVTIAQSISISIDLEIREGQSIDLEKKEKRNMGNEIFVNSP